VVKNEIQVGTVFQAANEARLCACIEAFPHGSFSDIGMPENVSERCRAAGESCTDSCIGWGLILDKTDRYQEGGYGC
jgi:hypothetical protein